MKSNSHPKNGVCKAFYLRKRKQDRRIGAAVRLCAAQSIDLGSILLSSYIEDLKMIFSGFLLCVLKQKKM